MRLGSPWPIIHRIATERSAALYSLIHTYGWRWNVGPRALIALGFVLVFPPDALMYMISFLNGCDVATSLLILEQFSLRSGWLVRKVVPCRPVLPLFRLGLQEPSLIDVWSCVAESLPTTSGRTQLSSHSQGKATLSAWGATQT